LTKSVDQEAAATIAVDGAFDDLVKEGADRLLWRQGRLEVGDALARRSFGIALQYLAEQRTLIAESVVKAGAGNAHAGGEIAHRGRLIAVAPEAVHRRIERACLIKLPRPRHRPSSRRSQIASAPSHVLEQTL
jgi:hypothetical protein